MARRPSKKAPFDIRLSAEEERDFTTRLCEDIRSAKRARSTHCDDYGLIDFAYSLYEQQSQKGISRDQPRYGSADLTSPIGTENVDALAARMVKTIFTEPLWIVEGVGEAAKKAPYVEEFMQWRQERQRLQKTCKRAFSAALVETGSVLEVCEDVECITKEDIFNADVQRNEVDGSIVLDAKTGKPVPAKDPETDEFLPAPDGAETYVEVHRRWTDYRRRGAYTRRRSMKDFYFLPSHAEDDREVYAHASRFWLRMEELTRRAEEGEFTHVDQLGGDATERQQSAEHDRAGVSVDTPQGYDLTEKELYRVQCWADLGDGLTCYIAVVSEQHDCLLSLKLDWLQRWRTIYLNPYPCPYSVYGYSMVLTKLLTTIEEHTAWRNMNADRSTLKSNAPMKRLRGSEWDPTTQPFGAGQTIDVANMNEIQPFEFEDVTQQALSKEQQCVTDAQRIVGMNDIALGQLSSQKRTLGENTQATNQSFLRTDDPIGNIQEAMEELGEVIHAIEYQALKEMPHGLEAPGSITDSINLQARPHQAGQQSDGDTSFDGTFTAEMIAPVGGYRFKPRGSTDEADPNRRQQVFINGITAYANLAKAIPGIAARMQTPEFADAVNQEWVTQFRPRDKAAFLKPLPPPPAQIPPGTPGQPAPGQPSPARGGAPGFGEQILQGLLANTRGGVQ